MFDDRVAGKSPKYLASQTFMASYSLLEKNRIGSVVLWLLAASSWSPTSSSLGHSVSQSKLWSVEDPGLPGYVLQEHTYLEHRVLDRKVIYSWPFGLDAVEGYLHPVA